MTNDDNFTRAAEDAADRTVRIFIGNNDAAYGYSSGFTSGAEWARAYLTAQKPDVQHLWRPGASPRTFCGDEPTPWSPVTREESLAVPVCALCHRRAMHEAHDQWARAYLTERCTACGEDPSGPLRPLATDERSFRYAQGLGYELPEDPR